MAEPAKVKINEDAVRRHVEESGIFPPRIGTGGPTIKGVEDIYKKAIEGQSTVRKIKTEHWVALKQDAMKKCDDFIAADTADPGTKFDLEQLKKSGIAKSLNALDSYTPLSFKKQTKGIELGATVKSFDEYAKSVDALAALPAPSAEDTRLRNSKFVTYETAKGEVEANFTEFKETLDKYKKPLPKK